MMGQVPVSKLVESVKSVSGFPIFLNDVNAYPNGEWRGLLKQMYDSTSHATHIRGSRQGFGLLFMAHNERYMGLELQAQEVERVTACEFPAQPLDPSRHMFLNEAREMAPNSMRAVLEIVKSIGDPQIGKCKIDEATKYVADKYPHDVCKRQSTSIGILGGAFLVLSEAFPHILSRDEVFYFIDTELAAKNTLQYKSASPQAPSASVSLCVTLASCPAVLVK